MIRGMEFGLNAPINVAQGLISQSAKVAATLIVKLQKQQYISNVGMHKCCIKMFEDQKRDLLLPMVQKKILFNKFRTQLYKINLSASSLTQPCSMTEGRRGRDKV